MKQLKQEDGFDEDIAYGGDSFRPRRGTNALEKEKFPTRNEILKGKDIIKFQVSKLKAAIIRDNMNKMDKTLTKKRYCSKETVKQSKKIVNNQGSTQILSKKFLYQAGRKSFKVDSKSTTNNLLNSKKRGSSLKELLSKVNQDDKAKMHGNRRELLKNVISPKFKQSSNFQKDQILKNNLLDNKPNLLMKTKKNKIKLNYEKIHDFDTRNNFLQKSSKKKIKGIEHRNGKKINEFLAKERKDYYPHNLNTKSNLNMKAQSNRYISKVKPVKPIMNKNVFREKFKNQIQPQIKTSQNTYRLHSSREDRNKEGGSEFNFASEIENEVILQTHNPSDYLYKHRIDSCKKKKRKKHRSSGFFGKNKNSPVHHHSGKKYDKHRKRHRSFKASKKRGGSLKQGQQQGGGGGKKAQGYQLKTLNDFLKSSKNN